MTLRQAQGEREDWWTANTAAARWRRLRWCLAVVMLGLLLGWLA